MNKICQLFKNIFKLEYLRLPNTVQERKEQFTNKVAETIKVGNIIQSVIVINPRCINIRLDNGYNYVIVCHGIRKSDQSIWHNNAEGW